MAAAGTEEVDEEDGCLEVSALVVASGGEGTGSSTLSDSSGDEGLAWDAVGVADEMTWEGTMCSPPPAPPSSEKDE